MTEGDEISTGGQLRKEASTWFARMRGPDAELHREEFERWLNRGAVHLGAYNRVAEIFSMGKHLAEEQSAKRRKRSRARMLAAALVIAVIAIGCSSMIILDLPRSDTPHALVDRPGDDTGARRYVALGKIEAFRLSDGSEIKLWPHSSLMVKMDRNRRNLRLEKGHGRFEVAHDGRTFTVYAGGGSVTALGTIFEVAVKDAKIDVHLARGSVAVRMPAPAQGSNMPQVAHLVPGQSISFAIASTRMSLENGTPSPLATPAARTFVAVRLADLVSLANQGGKQQIELEGKALQERRISGVFRIDDPQLLSDKLATLFDLQKQNTLQGNILLTPEADPQ